MNLTKSREGEGEFRAYFRMSVGQIELHYSYVGKSKAIFRLHKTVLKLYHYRGLVRLSDLYIIYHDVDTL